MYELPGAAQDDRNLTSLSLEISSPRSRCPQDWFLLFWVLPRFSGALQAILGVLWIALHHLISASILTLLFPVGVSVSRFLH